MILTVNEVDFYLNFLAHILLYFNIIQWEHKITS